MTAVDALRELLADYQGMDLTLLTAEFGMNKALRIRRARAALAAAEKDEGELVAMLREVSEYEGIREYVGSIIDNRMRAILSKHATPEHAKKG